MVKKATTAPKAQAKKSTAKKPSAPKTKAVAKTDEMWTPISTEDDVNSRPEHITETDVHTDTEGATFAPTLKLIQSLSPEIDEDEEKYVADCEAGDLIVDDGTTQTLFDGGIGVKVIPLVSRKRWTEWIPRSKGGGYVASYASKEEMESFFSSGNEVQVAIEYLCVTRDVSPDGEFTPVMLQFNSPTKLGIAREMAGHIEKFQTMYGIIYTIKSKKVKNKKGQRYFNYSVEPLGWVQEQIYSELEKLKLENEEAFVDEPSRLPKNEDDSDM